MAASSTQLACPHCGSMLTFGHAIAAGTPVECLICMQSFVAEPMASAAKPMPVAAAAPSIHDADSPTISDTATASMPKATPVPKAKPAAPVAISKPASTEIAVKPKMPVPVAAKANPDAELPAPPPIRQPVGSAVGSKIALFAVALGLAFLLTGGIVFAIVKITGSTRSGTENPGPQVADNGKKPASGKPANSDPGTGNPPSQDTQGASNAVVTEEEDEQIRLRIREEAKQSLKRKVPSTVGGDEPEWQPIKSVKEGGGPAPAAPALSEMQQKINDAIDKGLVYLKTSQFPNGTWSQGHAVGHAAIGGLTLLECKVPATDPAVQQAALFVRSNLGNLTATYELSLAILFLDRLGDPRDRTFIQGMAMRLIAGQYDSGGWHYDCPLLSPPEMVGLFNMLQATKKPMLLDPLQGKSPAGVVMNPVRDPEAANNPFAQFDMMQAMQPKDAVKPMPKAIPPKGKGKGPMQRNPAMATLTLRRGPGDNSNTQFALLALWTARRHDVPSENALLLAFQRFATSQNPDFGWGYHPRAGSTNTMTSVGLLGLAMGHGVNPEIIRFNPKDPKDILVKPALQDPKIQNGLQALARNIGDPNFQKNANVPMQNLYFLWSVERVAMLYDLKTIGGRDWYGWGAQILVHNQQPNGAWPATHYPGANPPVSTCFALLFLKRSNLVQDLTNHLRLYTGIRE